jgi:hypothetical protein
MASKKKSSSETKKKDSASHARTEHSSAHRKDSSAASHSTTDHQEIRRWAEERHAKPAAVEVTGNDGGIGIIRLEFPDAPNRNEESLHEITWDEFFEKFDDNGLMLVYQESTSGGQKSNFNKLVRRDSSSSSESGRSHPRASAAAASRAGHFHRSGGVSAEPDYEEDELESNEDEEDEII